LVDFCKHAKINRNLENNGGEVKGRTLKIIDMDLNINGITHSI
jgi:hypothetical protein